MTPTDTPRNATGPRGWLREPLLHFALIGILLFTVYGWMNPAGKTGDRIVVSRAVVDDLARQHEARWMRVPSEQELAGLVEAHVRDEILFREGVSLGLDRDDPVIKRRVRQKLDIVAEEQLASSAPTDADLAAYLSAHPDRFMRPAVVSFEQVFLDGSRPATVVEREAAAAKAALARGADPTRLGQPTLLPQRIDAVPIDRIARDFGGRFAQHVETLPLGEWAGPIASGLGAHLVRVSARLPAALPPLDAVRPQVAREWENARRERSRDESYRKLRAGYEVVIETALPPATAQR